MRMLINFLILSRVDAEVHTWAAQWEMVLFVFGKSDMCIRNNVFMMKYMFDKNFEILHW